MYARKEEQEPIPVEIKRGGLRKKKRVYYNVSIPHNDNISQFGEPTPAVFQEARDQPLFDGAPRDWDMSVVRFTIPTAYIPIQFFPVKVGTTNESLYSITLSYGGADFQQSLIWETQSKDVPVPPPATTDTIFNPQYFAYYSLFSLSHFCDIINKAISTCYNANIVPLLPVAPVGTTYKPPFITFNPATNLFTINYPANFLSTDPNRVELYFNNALNTNFDGSFDVEFFSFNEPDGKNVYYKVVDFGGSNFTPDATEATGGFYSEVQGYDSTGAIQSFTSIVIRSNSLPIINEAISLQPRGGNYAGSGTAGGSISIISDFEVDLGTGRNIKNFIHYVPTAEYRRITLQGNLPITRIDLEILWKDNYDNFYPVLIPAHDIATIKILFEEL